MYAMTGRLVARKGKRKELVDILNQAASLLGGISQCQLYIVNEDLSNDVQVWVYELWENVEAHDHSLTREDVRSLISQAKPLLASAPDGAELRVAGGYGL